MPAVRARRAVGRGVVAGVLDRGVEQRVGGVALRPAGRCSEAWGRRCGSAGRAGHSRIDWDVRSTHLPWKARSPTSDSRPPIACARSSTRSSAPRCRSYSRTRSGGTAAADPSTDWCVIACGTSISDSTPPSDSASVKTSRARGDPRRVRVAERDHAAEAGPADVVTPRRARAATRSPPARSRCAPPSAGAACAARGATRKQSSGPGTAPTEFCTKRTALVQRPGRARSPRRRPRPSARRGTSSWSARPRRRRARAGAGRPASRTCCRRPRARSRARATTAATSTTLSVGLVGVSTQISFVVVGRTAAATAARSRLVDHRVARGPSA